MQVIALPPTARQECPLPSMAFRKLSRTLVSGRSSQARQQVYEQELADELLLSQVRLQAEARVKVARTARRELALTILVVIVVVGF